MAPCADHQQISGALLDELGQLFGPLAAPQHDLHKLFETRRPLRRLQPADRAARLGREPRQDSRRFVLLLPA